MIVLAAHGTRDPAGAAVVERLASEVRARGAAVALAYADVREPDVTSVLGRVPVPAVVVPAFLAAGYHVRRDLPAQVAASGRRDVTIAEAFGPAPELIEVAHDRLREAGYAEGDTVVLAAAGSSDSGALADVSDAAHALATRLRTPVRVGYAATAEPTIAEAVADARRCGGRVLAASWLLAPGLFQRRIEAAGADATSAPLCGHSGAGRAVPPPLVIDLILRRYREARSAQAA